MGHVLKPLADRFEDRAWYHHNESDSIKTLLGTHSQLKNLALTALFFAMGSFWVKWALQ
jgi:hypothetical protein